MRVNAFSVEMSYFLSYFPIMWCMSCSLPLCFTGNGRPGCDVTQSIKDVQPVPW